MGRGDPDESLFAIRVEIRDSGSGERHEMCIRDRDNINPGGEGIGAQNRANFVYLLVG